MKNVWLSFYYILYKSNFFILKIMSYVLLKTILTYFEKM